MPFPRKPDHLKLLTGSRQPLSGPHVELPKMRELPAPPDWLDAAAVYEWRRLGPTLIATQLLTEASLSAFAVYCALHGKLVATFVAGITPTASLVAQWRALANDFGCTALGQQKLKPAPPPDAPNPFLALRDLQG